MSYRFEAGEAVPEAVRRVADEVLGGALEALDAGTDEGIHDARTGVKRARALLRLVRAEIGSSRFTREDERLGEAARGLSAARDAFVLIEALEALRARRPDAIDAPTFAAVRAFLADRRHGGAELAGARDAALEGLREARRAAVAWPIHDAEWRALRRGLVDVYGAGRARFRDAYEDASTAVEEQHAAAIEDPGDERFHALRKRVKALGYASELLRPIWPKLMKVEHEALKELGDRLGDDHDLGVLSATLVAHSALDPAARDGLRALIEGRRAELREEARAIAARIFGERPKAFGRRLGAYWKAWRHQEHDGAAGAPMRTKCRSD